MVERCRLHMAAPLSTVQVPTLTLCSCGTMPFAMLACLQVPTACPPTLPRRVLGLLPGRPSRPSEGRTLRVGLGSAATPAGAPLRVQQWWLAAWAGGKAAQGCEQATEGARLTHQLASPCHATDLASPVAIDEAPCPACDPRTPTQFSCLGFSVCLFFYSFLRALLISVACHLAEKSHLPPAFEHFFPPHLTLARS